MFETNTLVCSCLAEAIPRVLELVRYRGRPVYVRGELNREVVGADIVITDPTNRLPIVPGRRSITAFCVVEFLWYCAQRTELDSLAPYAPNICSYYGGARFTTGSDYGRQIFGSKMNGSQWEKVLALLRKDPGSKRAFIGIYNADEVPSLLWENPDIACTVGFQALVRDGQLHWITNMRANDAYRGFVSDTFSYTMFQELLAATLGIQIGQYLHRPASLHTFPEDERTIDRILSMQKKDRRAASRVRRMPPVQPEIFWEHLTNFWAIHDSSRLTGDWDPLRSLLDIKNDWWSWVAHELLKFHGLTDASQ